MTRHASVAGAALVLLLTGCSGGGTDSADGSSDPSTTPTSSASTPTDDSSATSEPTPTVEPATGPQLDVEGVKVNAPASWKQSYDTIVVDMAENDESGSLMLSVAGTGGDQLSLKQAEKYFWTRSQEPEGYEPQDTTVMGGLTAYHYLLRDRHQVTHAVGLWDAGYVVKVELSMPERVSEDEVLEVLDSVVATYESPRTAG